MLSLNLLAIISCLITVGNISEEERREIPIPEIAGEYIHIYEPQGDIFPGPDAPELKAGQYYEAWVPNDHCFIKGQDGRWHMFGITHPMTSLEQVHSGEYLSFHAVAPEGTFREVLKAHTWMDQPKILPPAERPGEILFNHAPSILRMANKYHMVYGPTPLRYAVSDDLYQWVAQGELTNPPPGRDPSFLLWDNSYHIMVCGRNEVLMAPSRDLVHCEPYRPILKMRDQIDPESPSIVRYNDTFYLFVCGWNGVLDSDDLNSAYQHITYVYQSDDPYHFDVKNEVATLEAHAPEIFQDEDGNWYISSAQWPNRGVSVAPLEWR